MVCVSLFSTCLRVTWVCERGGEGENDMKPRNHHNHAMLTYSGKKVGASQKITESGM